MIIKHLTWFIMLLTFAIVHCDNQGVCNKTQLLSVREWEPYTRRRVETYMSYAGGCYRYGCARTRWRIVNSERLVTKAKIDVTMLCCQGYKELERSFRYLKCAPICVPACRNAFCRAPGECECNPGYVRDPHDVRNCLPSCPEGTCDHGTCVAPNTCTCNFGYTMTNGTCRPICTDPCNNGKCVAPDTCDCHVGYRKSSNNVCEPYCSTGCENGTCVGPETCRCDPGFSEVGGNNNYTIKSCAPVCTDPCDNGTCVAPDTCQCLSGYEKSESDTCQPLCSEGCANGTCVAPETCRCDPGWAANITTNVCEPVCSEPCGNGTCTAPDTCECFPGYEWNSTCQPKCTGGCAGGECVSPDVCQCETGWEYKNGTCVPKCKYDCGNGTCVKPDVCHCFNGYRLDVEKLLRGNLTEVMCIPSCVNCSGACVAPNRCLVEVSTTEAEMEGDYATAISISAYDNVSDDYISSDNETLFTKYDKDYILNTSDGTSAQKLHWLEQHWTFIAVPVLLIVIITTVALVAFRWRFLRHYIKGESYTVQGNIADAQRTSSFVDVSFSALGKKDGMDAKY